MFKSSIRSALIGMIFPFAILTTVNANAETFAFSYTFEGNRFPFQTWAPGSILSGQFDGTIDPSNLDRVIINSFGQVVLNRTGLPEFVYDAIDASEFNGFGETPVMSFSGATFQFGVCPGGFIDDTDGDGVPDDCAYGRAPGGGFLMEAGASGPNFTTAADGTADANPLCRSGDSTEQRRMDGCRVVDAPIVPENWSLVALTDGDRDSVPDVDDNCPNTVIPESLPSTSLGVNRFALVDGDAEFDTTVSQGQGPQRSYTIADTTGCSCTQIIAAQGLGSGHTKFGCSIGAMDNWLDLVN